MVFLLFSKSILFFFWLPTANDTGYSFSLKEKYFHCITKSISSANQLYIHLKEDSEILASIMALHKEDGIPNYMP